MAAPKVFKSSMFVQLSLSKSTTLSYLCSTHRIGNWPQKMKKGPAMLWHRLKNRNLPLGYLSSWSQAYLHILIMNDGHRIRTVIYIPRKALHAVHVH